MIAVTQVSDAATRRGRRGNAGAAAAACNAGAVNTKSDLATVNNGQVRNYTDDQDAANKEASVLTRRLDGARNIGGRGAQGSQVAQPPATPAANTGQASQAGQATQPPAKGANSGQASQPAANGANNGQAASGAASQAAQPAATCPPAKGGAAAGAGGAAAAGANVKNGLEILGDSCAGSKLGAHTGFQEPNKCSSTQFGEVPAADKAPSLLITQAPQQVQVGQAFTIDVSTRNLVRDRFLGAALGGYYLESSFLNGQGLVRGHFHTACRMLANTNAAPDPAPAPAFFVATEDGKGGANPDTIKIQVTGMPSKGTAQCAAWAGDGSHRIPMMENAKQTPAFDAVRIQVN